MNKLLNIINRLSKRIERMTYVELIPTYIGVMLLTISAAYAFALETNRIQYSRAMSHSRIMVCDTTNDELVDFLLGPTSYKVIKNYKLVHFTDGGTGIKDGNNVYSLDKCIPVVKVYNGREVTCNGRLIHNATVYKGYKGNLYFDIGKGQLLTSCDCSLILK